MNYCYWVHVSVYQLNIQQNPCARHLDNVFTTYCQGDCVAARVPQVWQGQQRLLVTWRTHRRHSVRGGGAQPASRQDLGNDRCLGYRRWSEGVLYIVFIDCLYLSKCQWQKLYTSLHCIHYIIKSIFNNTCKKIISTSCLQFKWFIGNL